MRQPTERIRVKRRHFSALAASAPLTLGLPRVAWAQDAPVTAADYTKLGTPVPVSTPPGTVDVVEFFSFACPHCFEFEPVLEDWLKRKPADVRFRRSPVPFLQNFRNFQPMYFALESMGLAETMARKVFDAFQVQRLRLDNDQDIAAFMASNGVDARKFMAAFSNNFATNVKVNQANQLFEASTAHGVPTLMVQGRFLTSPWMARGGARALDVVEALAARILAEG